MSAVFTVEEFTAAMEAAVAERGEDWTYPKKEDAPDWWRRGVCRYVLDDGSPACIIGFALSKLIPNEEIPRTSISAYQAVRNCLGGSLGLAEAASTAQRVQDEGGTWGAALAAYKRILGLS